MEQLRMLDETSGCSDGRSMMTDVYARPGVQIYPGGVRALRPLSLPRGCVGARALGSLIGSLGRSGRWPWGGSDGVTVGGGEVM
jgi:hypothetical protein